MVLPDLAERLDKLVEGWESMLEWYNYTIAPDFEEHSKRSDSPSPFRMDAQVIREQAQD